MSTLKGFVMNVKTPALANALSAQRGRIDWGAWCYDANLQYANGFKWVIDLTHCRDEEAPPLSSIAQAKQHSAYSGWYFLLNEPDLAYPKDQLQPVATEILAQMDEVLAQDVNAKFILACGTYLNPPWIEDSWHDALWALIPKAKRGPIRGFHSHIYPNNKIGLVSFLNQWQAWRVEKFPNRSLHLGEVGRVIGNTNSAYTPTSVHNKCELRGIDEWYWYAEAATAGTPAANCDCLYDNVGALTEIGQEFAEL